MRKYHFNLTDGVALLKHESYELEGPAAARSFARILADEIIAESQVPVCAGWSIKVTDEESKFNFEVPVLPLADEQDRKKPVAWTGL
jgi:hypothetical protein